MRTVLGDITREKGKSVGLLVQMGGCVGGRLIGVVEAGRAVAARNATRMAVAAKRAGHG